MSKKKPRRWRKVSDREWVQISQEFTAGKRGPTYNGCIGAALVERYGEGNLVHKIGHGWYKLTDGSERPPLAKDLAPSLL